MNTKLSKAKSILNKFNGFNDSRVGQHPAKPTSMINRFVLTGVAAIGLISFSALASVSPPKLGPDHKVQLLSPPSSDSPMEIASSYLASHANDLGLTVDDVGTLVLGRQFYTEGLGTNVFFEQRVNGIPVFNGITSVHVLDNGAIVTINNTAVDNINTRLTATEPVVLAADAFQLALQHLGVSSGTLDLLTDLDPDRQGVAFSGQGVTRKPVPVQLIYTEGTDGLVHLAWEIYAMTAADQVWYLHIDAANGAVLENQNLVLSLNKYRVYGFNSESPISTETPVDMHHELVAETGDLEASPTGWHSGSSTTGNNVEAVEDRDDNDSGGFQPLGAGLPGNLVFDFAHDNSRSPCEQPSPLSNIASNPENLEPCDAHNVLDHNTNMEAAVVNLFYWNNIMHDVMYHYGFTEGAGNFQQTNYTAEGTLRDYDAVFAQAQDGSGTNNANFFTPPDDGITPLLLPPAMQMYEWSPPAVVRVNQPSGFAEFDDGDNILSAATASFGTSLKNLSEADRTGDVEAGNDSSLGDGTGAETDGCEPLVGFTAGKIALLDRGFCEFGTKVLNAENAGAKGVVLANTLGREVGTPMGPGVDGPQVTIPSVMIGESNGNLIRAALDTGIVNLTMQILPVPNRDSDFDAGVIAHEYGHGISNRLVGGPSSIACLFNALIPDPNNPGATTPIGEQMGEGWSDMFGLMLTAQASDTADTPRGVGAYISYQDEDGPGIRRFPYSRDMEINPFTYADVAGETAPHGVGSVWATMIWDMNWSLIDEHGFEADLFNHSSEAGNVRALHYMNNGMIVTKCRPSFVDSRNAILTAITASGNSADVCPVWRAFARRGLGVAAINPTAGEDHRNVVEDFTLPPHCASEGNSSPEAENDKYTTRKNSTLTVTAPGILANDSDPEGQALTAGLIRAPGNASSFKLNSDGSFEYTPRNGFQGIDTFGYVAQDGELSSAEATVTIEVTNKKS